MALQRRRRAAGHRCRAVRLRVLWLIVKESHVRLVDQTLNYENVNTSVREVLA